MSKATIRIGTRKSKLALWQTEKVASLLQQAGFHCEVDTMETIGDKILDTSIAKIGSKGVFTAELEERLAAGEIDIAVHSAKDMQSLLPEGFEIIAYTKREEPYDVLLSGKEIALDSCKPFVIGTSSVRRRAFLRHYYPHLELVEMRGNLQTRIAKMERGDCDALMLAYAGVFRMGYEKMIVKKFSCEDCIPPVGQGCIAVEASLSLDEGIKDAIRKAVNDSESEICLTTERAFLKKMDGGCSIPVFGYARTAGNMMQFKAGIAALDGHTIICKKGEIEVRSHSAKYLQDAALFGEQIAEAVLEKGGRELLAAIKEAQK